MRFPNIRNCSWRKPGARPAAPLPGTYLRGKAAEQEQTPLLRRVRGDNSRQHAALPQSRSRGIWEVRLCWGLRAGGQQEWGTEGVSRAPGLRRTPCMRELSLPAAGDACFLNGTLRLPHLRSCPA